MRLWEQILSVRTGNTASSACDPQQLCGDLWWIIKRPHWASVNKFTTWLEADIHNNMASLQGCSVGLACELTESYHECRWESSLWRLTVWRPKADKCWSDSRHLVGVGSITCAAIYVQFHSPVSPNHHISGSLNPPWVGDSRSIGRLETFPPMILR